ncbi:MAG TPA: hypothetical protein VJC05_04505 [Candidatus Andersenbacteria bacterium]|nr:hypothetical protein [Candidatus Andersenbacteria bacterium]
MLPVDPKQLTLLRPITWDEVFSTWRANEAQQPRWIEHYTSRGFTSWEEWRSRHVVPLRLDQREWVLYRIIDPLHSVPLFYGGPFTSWKQKHYGERDRLTFGELAALPAIDSHEVINAMVDNFPSPTQLIGLWQLGTITIGDGMHRCCALALAARRGRKITPEVTIALADFSGENLALLDSVKNE